jgi:hypothetical protein
LLVQFEDLLAQSRWPRPDLVVEDAGLLFEGLCSARATRGEVLGRIGALVAPGLDALSERRGFPLTNCSSAVSRRRTSS